MTANGIPWDKKRRVCIFSLPGCPNIGYISLNDGGLRAAAMEQIVSGAKSPLDILLTVMRARFEAEDFNSAVAIAKAVAPFVHAKPRPRPGGETLGTLRDQQLVELCGSSVARAGAPDADTS
jgi:hypothetical protein